MNSKKLRLILCWIILTLSAVLAGTAHAADMRHVMGDAAEGLMQDYFTQSGWQSLSGQTGRQGIDGLFVKTDANGTIKDILIAESKYNTSQLASDLKCGGNQMSAAWVQCKLSSLIQDAESKQDNERLKHYRQIEQQVKAGNYRSRLWRVGGMQDGQLRIDLQDISSTGTDVNTADLKGGAKYKIQYASNQTIDLANPRDEFQRKIVDGYYRNLDAALEKQGISATERNRLMTDIRHDPKLMGQVLDQHAARIAATTPKPVKVSLSPSIRISAANSKVADQYAKRTVKSLLSNVKAAFGTAAAGATLGPIGAAAGFVVGLVGGIAADYVIDAAVNTAMAAEPATSENNEASESNEAVRQEVAQTNQRIETLQNRMTAEFAILGNDLREQHAADSAAVRQEIAQTNQRIETLQNRMTAEFAILGNDLRERHAAEMAAIQNNLQEILKVGQAVEQVNLKLVDIGNQLISISESLASLSTKVDQIQSTLNALIRADFDSGIEYLGTYQRTQEKKHLDDALTSLIKFKNILLNQPQGQQSADAQQLALAYYFLAATYADLYKATRKAGYAEDGLAQFIQLADQTAELSLLSATYLAIRDLDTQGKAAQRLTARYLDTIREFLATGHLNQARQQASALNLLVINDDSARIQTAVAQYIAQGRDNSGLLNVEDPVYSAIRRCLKGCELSSLSGANLPDYVRSLATSHPSPTDFQALLTAYDSSDLAKEAVRHLINNQYHQDALTLLRDHGVGDDDFRVKAYLLIYDQLGLSKRDQLKQLVLSNPTYSQAVKTFAAKLGTTPGT